MPTVLNTKEQIAAMRLSVLHKALGLEIKGMTRNGKSAYAILKDELKLSGNRRKVYDQVSKIIFELKQLNLPLEEEND